MSNSIPKIIACRWSSTNPDDLFDVDNPATGDLIARVQGSGVAEANAAVSAAHAAFIGHWRSRPARE